MKMATWERVAFSHMSGPAGISHFNQSESPRTIKEYSEEIPPTEYFEKLSWMVVCYNENSTWSTILF